jgi:hypothetical protein
VTVGDLTGSAGGTGDELDTLVHRGDLDGLVRLVDSLCAGRQWAELLTLRDRCRAAVATGRQLWPAATLAEYRLALWAPAEWAARVLDDDSGRFTIGPLTEVAAQHHSYGELAALAATIDAPHRLGLVAHERALRGETIPETAINTLGIPFDRQPWEPQYCLATYSDDGIEAPPPRLPDPAEFRHVTIHEHSPAVDDPDVELAVRQLFDVWTASSTGHAEVACVEGDAAQAVAALGPHQLAVATITAPEATAWLAWAGASGAAHGRRRGAAAGRFGAWSVLAALTDTDLDDPVALAGAIASLRWYWWSAGEPAIGWRVQLAAESALSGYAWAISAHDAV